MPKRSTHRKVSDQQRVLKRYPTWDTIHALLDELIAKIKNERIDAFLILVRGGLAPGAIITKGMHVKSGIIYFAHVRGYDDDTRLKRLRYFSWPSRIVRFNGKLVKKSVFRGKRVCVIDDVCDTGRTAYSVMRRIRREGGDPFLTVVFHKPTKADPNYPIVPDFYARVTKCWIVYPWENGPRNKKSASVKHTSKKQAARHLGLHRPRAA